LSAGLQSKSQSGVLSILRHCAAQHSHGYAVIWGNGGPYAAHLVHALILKMDRPMLYVFNNTNGVKIIWNATVTAKTERRKTGFMSLLRTQFGG
jgi:hypothetical protein